RARARDRAARRRDPPPARREGALGDARLRLRGPERAALPRALRRRRDEPHGRLARPGLLRRGEARDEHPDRRRALRALADEDLKLASKTEREVFEDRAVVGDHAAEGEPPERERERQLARVWLRARHPGVARA